MRAVPRHQSIPVPAQIEATELVARSALGLIWLYLGLFPKLLWQVPEEVAIVERTGLFVVSPAWTITAVGVLEIACGIWLLTGWQARAAVVFVTALMLAMMLTVIPVEPSLLLGPFGGLVKNLALLACAWIVWMLAGKRS